MPENPSYRYYMITASPENGEAIQKNLESLFPEDNICQMNDASFVVRSNKHGQNAEFVFQSLDSRLENNCCFFVSSLAIRTLLGNNLPGKIQAWRDAECKIAKQYTMN